MSQYRKVLSAVTLNVSRADSTFGNTFHVNPHVADRLYDRYTSALSPGSQCANRRFISVLVDPDLHLSNCKL